MKKLFTFLLALAASVGTIFAASGTCGPNLTWDLTDGVLTISGTGAMTDYTSSSPWYSSRSSIKTVNIGDGVTSIGELAFWGCESLTSVTIPNSVTSIGEKAFYKCTSLTSVTIPNSVTSIGDYVFDNCSSLTSVTIGNSVTSIGWCAFYSCTGLTAVHISDLAAWCKIQFDDEYANPLYYANNLYLNGELVTDLVIPNSVTSIGNRAFSDCESLTSVTIPNSVTSIGDGAFSGCSGLTSVTIPNSVTSIGNTAFLYCSSLTSINVANDNPNYSSEDGVLYNKDKTTLILCPGGKQGAFDIPNSVTSIGDYAFYRCSSLTSVTIPNSVTTIEHDAFYGCSGLTAVHISDLAAWCNIQFSDNPLYDAHNLYINGELVTDLVIPSSVTSIRYGAFQFCSSLTSVTIPNSVTSIGEGAFAYCSSLTSVTIPNSVTSIGQYAFAGCESLTSVTIPNSVISIGDGTFQYCRSLTSVIIGNGVKEIKYCAFADCPLKNITLGTGLRKISIAAFFNNVEMEYDEYYKQPMPKTDAAGNYIYTVEKVVCYAKVPPTIDVPTGSNLEYFIDNFANATIYVLAESVAGYRAYNEAWGRLDLRPIGAEPVITDNMVITPSENSADVIWPAVTGAATYELVIKDKQGNIICTLIFNAQGQLTSIAFHAPARGEAPQQTQAAGFSFTVTGLDSGCSYDLTMASKDEKGNTIDEKHLSFSTTDDSPTAIDAVETSKLGGSTKILHNGQVFIQRDSKLYTVQGQKVR